MNTFSTVLCRFGSPTGSAAPLVVLWSLLLSSIGASSQSFADANRAFAEQRYADAIRGYEQIIQRQGYSAPVLFNLGNACLRQGNHGMAILNYKRAQRLAPNDPDIAANLRFAREQAALPVPEMPWYEKPARKLSANAWSWTASVALAVLCGALLAARLASRGRSWIRLIVSGSVLLLFAAAGSILLWAREADHAVISGTNVVARISPLEEASTAFPLKAGETVTLERHHRDYVLVRNGANRAGWVSRDALKALMNN